MRLTTTVLTLGLLLPACGDDNDGSAEGGTGSDTGTGGNCEVESPLDLAPTDESNCTPASSDYQPGQDDPWPACAPDDGSYPLIADTPSSIARVEAFDQIMMLLDGEPDADAFTEARTVYSIDEGLESRLVRREDLFFPAIPESDWDPGVDPDKQCTVEGNVEKYPERCAGPARIAPIINEAFAAGQSGEGEPLVHAARIEAAGLWFLHLSVYKEANTCLLTAKDCDSSWAYYTGGFDRGGGIGLSAEVQSLSSLAHNRIWDGFAAVRCWRELYPIEDFPTVDDVDAEGQALLDDAYAQLDKALWYGWAQIIRSRLEQQGGVCGLEAEANWEFLKIAGPVLSEQTVRLGDADAAASLTAMWSGDAPTAEEIQTAADTIDALFGCP